MADLYATLQLEPLSKSIDEIADMTDEQILCLVAELAQRNREREAARTGVDTTPALDVSELSEFGQFVAFARLGRQLGGSREYILSRWQEQTGKDARDQPWYLQIAWPPEPGAPSAPPSGMGGTGSNGFTPTPVRQFASVDMTAGLKRVPSDGQTT